MAAGFEAPPLTRAPVGMEPFGGGMSAADTQEVSSLPPNVQGVRSDGNADESMDLGTEYKGRKIEMPFDHGTWVQMQEATLKRYAGVDAKREAAQEMLNLEAQSGEEPQLFCDRQVQLLRRLSADTNDELVARLQRMWSVHNRNLFARAGQRAESMVVTEQCHADDRSDTDDDEYEIAATTAALPHVAGVRGDAHRDTSDTWLINETRARRHDANTMIMNVQQCCTTGMRTWSTVLVQATGMSSGACRSVVACMRAHISDAAVQRRGAQAVAELAYNYGFSLVSASHSKSAEMTQYTVRRMHTHNVSFRDDVLECFRLRFHLQLVMQCTLCAWATSTLDMVLDRHFTQCDRDTALSSKARCMQFAQNTAARIPGSARYNLMQGCISPHAAFSALIFEVRRKLLRSRHATNSGAKRSQACALVVKVHKVIDNTPCLLGWHLRHRDCTTKMHRAHTMHCR
ncbi:hypothetical protein JKP88DRAFT_247536 [Tribonema minus]|uniref:Uncharacterized protein n=1 Tax=Tribonema minus TaxID=303371 RepID=A0A836CCR0_9STRA|nr:hypothetical protein JKP88DRAFT_247536 [Tribonema minus]